MVEYEELGLVLARAEQVRAQTSATADHLPELDPGFDRLGEDQIDHFRHVDTGVEHVHRDGDTEVVLRLLELLDQRIHMRNFVVDDLADLGAVLRVELAEQLFQMLGMVLPLGKDDCLAHQ